MTLIKISSLYSALCFQRLQLVCNVKWWFNYPKIRVPMLIILFRGESTLWRPKNLWNTYSYIEYELIVPFQFHMKSSIHVISQKHLDEVFHSNKHNCVERKIVEKSLSFERQQELYWRPLYQNIFYMSIKTLDEIKEKLTPKNTKCTKKKKHFLA